MTTPPKSSNYKTSPTEAEPDSKFRTVFVSGLSYSTTEEDITRFFSKCAPIEYFSINFKINSNFRLIKLPRYKSTKRNTGYCHITFETEASRAIVNFLTHSSKTEHRL